MSFRFLAFHAARSVAYQTTGTSGFIQYRVPRYVSPAFSITRRAATCAAAVTLMRRSNHMPVNTGGRGKHALRAFYRDDFIPSWPDDLQTTPVNRVVGEGQLVDELHLTFTHSKPMPWLLPGVPPTRKKIAMDVVVVVQFRGDKLACERIYWDHAAVLRQAGLLKE